MVRKSARYLECRKFGAAVGSVAVPAVGQVGKMIADRGTRREVDNLLRIIQNGGKKNLNRSRASFNDKDWIKSLIAGRAAGALTSTP